MSKARGLADLGNVYNDGALSNRNLIINGAMQVAQRGTSFTVNSPAYTVDRWEMYPGANPGVIDASRLQFNASDDMLVVSGFNYYLSTVYSTGVGGAAYDNRHFRINQENAYFYAGKTFTISFWAKSDTNRKLGLETRLNAGATEDTLHKSVLDASGWQLSTSWQYFTHTFTIPALVTTSASIESSVASFHITVDPVSTGATYDITGVQLEVGDTATPFEHRSYAQELALCQRYFQRFAYSQYNYFGIAVKPTGVTTALTDPKPYIVSMRVRPTGAISNSLGNTPVLININSGTYSITGLALNTYGGDNTWWVQGASSLPVRNSDFYESGGSGVTNYDLDAEL